MIFLVKSSIDKESMKFEESLKNLVKLKSEAELFAFDIELNKENCSFLSDSPKHTEKVKLVLKRYREAYNETSEV